MDTNQWPQAIGLVKPIIHHQESSSPPKGNSNIGGDQRKPRPQKEQVLNCPRCNSTNTKFCYYNNYSLTQPRYFCKTCRRYWTEGGTLRNVPVGGGSRKNKRSSSSSISSAQAQKITKNPNSDLSQIPSFPQNPSKIHEGHDLNLAYHDVHDTTITTTSGLLGLNYLPYPINNNGTNPNLSGISPKSLSSLMAMPNLYSPSLLPMQQDFSNKPKLSNFCLDGFDHTDQNGYSTAAKLFFPNYEDLKPLSMSEQFEQRQQEQAPEQVGGGGQGGGGGGGEYWSGGMINGGSW